MKLSRTSVGLAVRAAREAAGLTLDDLAGMTGITTSSLSRTERGERDLAFAEFVAIAQAAKVDFSVLHDFADTFERAGVAHQQKKATDIKQDLNELQRLAIEAAIAARAHTS